jgi:hypothetical protein
MNANIKYQKCELFMNECCKGYDKIV